MNTKEGRKVNHTTVRVAATAPHQLPSRFQPPMKPTKATTMISGPGVVSPRARPSAMAAAVSQWNWPTAPWAT